MPYHTTHSRRGWMVAVLGHACATFVAPVVRQLWMLLECILPRRPSQQWLEVGMLLGGGHILFRESFIATAPSG